MTLLLFFFALLFGGGGADGPLQKGAIDGLAAITLVLLMAAHFNGTRPLPSQAIFPLSILVALLIIICSQIIPVPPSLWRSLGGRDLAASALALTPYVSSWRPLSLNPEATRAFATSLFLPAAIILGTLGGRRTDLRIFARAVVAAAALSSLIGALQLALGQPEWLSFYGGQVPGAASGIFANPNHQAAFLSGALVCLAIMIRTGDGHLDVRQYGLNARIHAGWLIMPVFIIMILATGSRAATALLPLVAIGSVVLALRLIQLVKLSSVVIMLVVFALGALVFFPSNNALALRESFSLGDDARFYYLPDVMFTLWQYWPWGSGFSTFTTVFPPNENLDIAGSRFLNHAHNDILEWIIESGAVGLAWLLLVLLGVIFAAVRSIGKRMQHQHTLVFALCGMFILFIFLMLSLLDYPLRTRSVLSIASLAVAFIFVPSKGVAAKMSRSDNASRWVWLGALVLGVLLATQTLRIRAAEAGVRSQQTAAAVLRPQNSKALALVADAQLKQGQKRVAAQTAMKAIDQAPMTVQAIRVLAMAERPDSSRAVAAWRIASAMGWRDGPTQVWAFRQALLNEEFSIAATRADAFLRTRGKIPDEYLTLVRVAAVNRQFREALADRIKLRPPWRGMFFAVSPGASHDERRGVEEILRALAANDDRPSRAEVQPLIGELIRSKNYRGAVDLYWLVAGRPRAPGEFLADGNFDRRIEDYRQNSTVFDWRIMPVEGATLSIEEQAGRSLIAEVDGSAAPTLINRYVPVDPGVYHLSYLQGGERDSPEGISLTVNCITGSNLGSSAARPLRGSEFESRVITFSVPANCPIIGISLSGKPIGRPTSAYFDRFSLRRAD